MNTIEIKNVLEAALLCSAEPLSMPQLRKLFNDEYNAELLRPLLDELALDWDDRSVELASVASGWRFQSKPQYAMFINRLTPEKAPKYSRAVMETLAIIAYRQPVTRGDIEEIRGVSVGSQIIKTLEDRGWIDVIGHKEVPGRPALFATTKQFLDDLNLLSIKELPPIDEMGGEESADFFAQQVTEAIEAEGASEQPGSNAEQDGGAQEDGSPAPQADAIGDPASESAPNPESETAPEAVSELHLESDDRQASGQDAANDQDGADVPAATAAASVSGIGQENEFIDPEPGLDEAQAGHDTAEVLEVSDIAGISETSVSDTENDHPVVLGHDGAPNPAGGVSDEVIADEPGDKTEPAKESDPTVAAADGDFLAAATAEAVVALSEADNAASDAPVEEPSNTTPDTKPPAPVPGALKSSGLAADDPNLEQVDWPDLPSLDGLDDAAQESPEQASEQDPPGGESEPVESR